MFGNSWLDPLSTKTSGKLFFLFFFVFFSFLEVFGLFGRKPKKPRENKKKQKKNKKPIFGNSWLDPLSTKTSGKLFFFVFFGFFGFLEVFLVFEVFSNFFGFPTFWVSRPVDFFLFFFCFLIFFGFPIFWFPIHLENHIVRFHGICPYLQVYVTSWSFAAFSLICLISRRTWPSQLLLLCQLLSYRQPSDNHA